MRNIKRKLQEFYNQNIEYWEKHPRLGVRDQYLEMLKLEKNQCENNRAIKILDIGCGCGHDAIKISEALKKTGLSFKGIGIDFCPKAIENVNNKDKEYLNEWEFLSQDFFDIKSDSAENDKFDIVVCSMVIMHYQELDEIFEIFSSFLSNNSKLLLVTNNPYLVSYEYDISYQSQGSYIHEFVLDSNKEKVEVEKFQHSLPSYFDAAKKAHLTLDSYKEIFFYGNDTNMYNNQEKNKLGFPNFIAMLFKKNQHG